MKTGLRTRRSVRKSPAQAARVGRFESFSSNVHNWLKLPRFTKLGAGLAIKFSVTACLRDLATGDLTIFREFDLEADHTLNARFKRLRRIIQLN